MRHWLLTALLALALTGCVGEAETDYCALAIEQAVERHDLPEDMWYCERTEMMPDTVVVYVETTSGVKDIIEIERTP